MTTSMLCFNSIVVRLKGRDRILVWHARILFQFHSGSIKRKPAEQRHVHLCEFQFHSGSIKSPALLIDRAPHRWSFNSIVVRLKGGLGAWSVGRLARFNSIVVRLKGESGQPNAKEQAWFQFHSGSIKRRPSQQSRQIVCGVSIP